MIPKQGIKAGWFKSMMVRYFIREFKRNPLAKNYMSQVFHDPQTGESFELCVQRVEGLTPSEKCTMLMIENNAMRRELDATRLQS